MSGGALGGGTPQSLASAHLNSPSVDRMPHLKELVLNADDASSSASQPVASHHIDKVSQIC
ncbi:unnamed protein product [Gongylonema pulchrum]|uniref:GLI2 n=1 Tax=Gongylonema pulchrum TaxID=637853 RepID=A0A183EXS1_9BILA|nr:unnamed protein product [Gongylonema pulchrum]